MAADRFRLTVLATSDLHSHILDWDYFTDQPYSDPAGNHVGLARISTLINQVRADREPGTTLTVDNGDTIEGTPLAYYYARRAPQAEHPVAAAMNTIGFDAASIGNHEFNYGLDVLRSFAAQAEHPMLCANALDPATGEPAFTPWVLRPVESAGTALTVGILGLVTPGCAIWDKGNLEGRVSFTGIVEQARTSVPELRAAGADVVLVLCHSGADTSSSYGDALPWPENAAGLLAEEVEGIDAIVVGHAHVEIGQRHVVNRQSGRPVLLSEPFKWGMRLSVLDLDLARVEGRWQVLTSTGMLLDARDAEADPAVEAAVQAQHETVRGYVNSVIGTNLAAMTTERSRLEATPIIDLINHVQASAVRAALADTEWAALPVLAVAAAFSRDAGIPAGPVTVRDIAGVYNYDNTLVAVVLTGAEVRAYLEHAADYYRSVTGPGPHPAAALTNAVGPLAPRGMPDYSYDMLSGLDAELAYDIDLSAPVGARITRLDYAGRPVGTGQRFVLAVNNYRQSGGGNYPAVRTAPVVYDALAEIRQLIIDWVSDRVIIDPAEFTHRAWRLVAGAQPLIIT